MSTIPPPHEDTPGYLAALRQFLAPIEGTAYHAGAWFDRTDVGRFHGYIDIVEQHHSLAGATVLDAGMGTGGLLLAARQRGARRLLGVEVDQATCDLAALRLTGPTFDLRLTDGERLPWPDGAVDVAFSMHVIEHAVDAAGYMCEISRVLKPGGAVLVSCPNRIVPREVHGDVPYITWLPITMAKRFCLWRSQAAGVPEPIRRQYHTATLVSHFVSYVDLRRWWRAAGLVPLTVNPPWRCAVLPSDLGAWGAAHPMLRLPFRAINNGLLHRVVAPAVRQMPDGRLARWVARWVSWVHLAVLRKP